MHHALTALLGVCVVALALQGFAAGPDPAGYTAIAGPCNLHFPADHGPHPGYHTEWWYVTGNLRSESGERFGYQLTFFRRQLSPPGSEAQWPSEPSAWRSQQLYLAHAAVSEIDGGRFHHAERLGREALGIAGASQEGATTRVFLRDWSLSIGSDGLQLQASDPKFALELALDSLKPPVLHGKAGYSLKGRSPESASCYTSLTRLQTKGTLSLAGRTMKVTGSSWLDHEFSSAPLEPDLAGWDWFGLQLSDGTELMVYLLRQADGTLSPASAATWVDTSGTPVHLDRNSFTAEVIDRWTSPITGATYPSAWKLHLAPPGLHLTVRSRLEDQEMQTPESTRVTYWEGSVAVDGAREGKPLTGEGYMELTGYAKPWDTPL